MTNMENLCEFDDSLQQAWLLEEAAIHNHILWERIQEFSNEIIELVGRSGEEGIYVRWDDIEPEDRQQFVALFLEYDNRDLLSIYENNEYDDIVSSLIVALKNFDTNTEVEFAKIVKDRMVSYYKERIMKAIKEKLDFINRLR